MIRKSVAISAAPAKASTQVIALAGQALGRPKRTLPARRRLDAAFVARLITGERAAWRDFWKHYRAMMWQQIRLLIGPQLAHAVDEIVAEIMVMLCDDAYRRLRAYDPTRAALSTYLHTIARNAAIDCLRRLKPAEANVSLAELPPMGAPDPCHATLVAQSELRRLVEALSPCEAQVIDALVGHDDDPEAVARVLGIGLQTVYSRKHKAMRKMQRVAQCAAA